MGVVVLIGRAGLWSRSTGGTPTKIEPSTFSSRVLCEAISGCRAGSNCFAVGETLVICPRLEVEGCTERPGDENIASRKISTWSLCHSKEKDGGRILTRGFALRGSSANRRVLHPLPVASVL